MNRSEVVEAIESIAGKVYSTKDKSLVTECDEQFYCIYIIEEDRGAFLEASIDKHVAAYDFVKSYILICFIVFYIVNAFTITQNIN